jgi:hypothetical protein
LKTRSDDKRDSESEHDIDPRGSPEDPHFGLLLEIVMRGMEGEQNPPVKIPNMPQPTSCDSSCGLFTAKGDWTETK